MIIFIWKKWIKKLPFLLLQWIKQSRILLRCRLECKFVSSRMRVEKCACRWGITWASANKTREKNGAQMKLFNRIDLMIYLTLTCTSKCAVIVIDWYFKMNSVEPTRLVIPSHFIRLINRILIIILFILASIYDNHNIFHLCANCLFAFFGSLLLPSFIGCILMSLKYLRFCLPCCYCWWFVFTHNVLCQLT